MNTAAEFLFVKIATAASIETVTQAASSAIRSLLKYKFVLVVGGQNRRSGMSVGKIRDSRLREIAIYHIKESHCVLITVNSESTAKIVMEMIEAICILFYEIPVIDSLTYHHMGHSYKHCCICTRSYRDPFLG